MLGSWENNVPFRLCEQQHAAKTRHIHGKNARSGLYELTDEIGRLVALSEMTTGLVTIFCAHTSASLLIEENADPDVRRDLNAFFRRLVPEGDDMFVHTAEGPDDMPAHVKAALTQASLGISVNAGRMVLGTWQGEHRTAPHTRRIVVHVLGTSGITSESRL